MSTHSWEYFQPVGMIYPVEDRAAEHEGRHVPKRHPPPEVLTDLVSKRMLVTPNKVGVPIGELMYFPLRARGEPLRFLLHYAGLPYEMNTIALSEWPSIKETTPGNQLPVFTPLHEEAVTDSPKIALYIAKMANMPGLVPSDDSAAKMYDVCNTAPCAGAQALLNWFTVAESEPKLAGDIAAIITEIKKFESQLTGPFFGGEKPHYGEFALMHLVDVLKSLDPKTLDTLGSKFSTWFAGMCNLKGVKGYLKSRPKAKSGSVGREGSRIATLDVD